ncbi:hypothetical protein RI065_02100 [Mycoplasmatota bacterium zrk1]
MNTYIKLLGIAIIFLYGCTDKQELTINLDENISTTYEVSSEEPDWASSINVSVGEKKIVVRSDFINENVNMNEIGVYTVNIQVPDDNNYEIIGEKTFEITVTSKTMDTPMETLQYLYDGVVKVYRGKPVDANEICTSVGASYFVEECIDSFNEILYEVNNSADQACTECSINILSATPVELSENDKNILSLSSHNVIFEVIYSFEANWEGDIEIDSDDAYMILEDNEYKIILLD